MQFAVVQNLIASRGWGIDRRAERCGDNLAGVIKLMASQASFLANPESARIRLIRQNRRQIFQCRISLRTNRPELDEISFSLYSGDVDRPRSSTA